MLDMQWVVFALVTAGAAAVGIGMVLAAAHIERARLARHTERYR
jgi:hypothetical protein